MKPEGINQLLGTFRLHCTESGQTRANQFSGHLQERERERVLSRRTCVCIFKPGKGKLASLSVYATRTRTLVNDNVNNTLVHDNLVN